MVLFHPFGGDDSIHQYIQQVNTINIPHVQYEIGAGKVQQSLPKDNEYIQTNFVEDPVICFPPSILANNVENDDCVGLLVERYRHNFEAEQEVCKHTVVHINKQKYPLLLKCFEIDFEGEDMVIVFDATLNIIILTIFSNSTSEVDIHNNLKQLESTLKSFVRICADLIKDDIASGNHLVIVGVVCFTSPDNIFDNKWLTSCSGTFCLKDFLAWHHLGSQENFDQWYHKVKD